MDFSKVAARTWANRQGDAQREMHKLNARLDEQRTLKSELLKMRMRGELTSEEFEQAKAELAVETYQLEESMQLIASKTVTADSFVRFAELHLVDLAKLWTIAGPEQKQRVQKLLFSDGLAYSPTSKLLNRSKSSLFNALEEMKPQPGRLVGPEGFEPPTKGL